MIDLTADEHPFYFNPYSGELSLKFPKAERNCKGGILALVFYSPK
jgi:DNA repair protein RAD5